MLSKPKQESPESPVDTQGSDRLIKRQLLQEEKKKKSKHWPKLPFYLYKMNFYCSEYKK